MMKRRSWLSALAITAAGVLSLPAMAQDEAPDALVKRISSDVLAAVKADPAIQAMIEITCSDLMTRYQSVRNSVIIAPFLRSQAVSLFYKEE